MFNWIILLDVAEKVLCINDKAIDREYLQRTAINRAYYALHCHTSLLASKKGFKPTSKDSTIHAQVINYLKNSTNKKLKVVGNELSILSKYRRSADYSETVTLYDGSSYDDLLCSNLINRSRTSCSILSKELK